MKDELRKMLPFLETAEIDMIAKNVEKQNKKYEEQMKKARGEFAEKSAKKTRSAKKAA